MKLSGATVNTRTVFSFSGKDGMHQITEKDVTDMGAMIMVTGQGTTPITMDILIGLLVNHPDVQERAYNCIRDAIGDRIPTCDDKAKLPYIEAVILESMFFVYFDIVSYEKLVH